MKGTAHQRVIEALQAAGSKRGSGRDWKCPAHEDRRASLGVIPGDRGVILKCAAGCDTKDVAAKLGLRMADLFDEPRHKNGSKPRQAIVETYTYIDEHSEPLFEVVRFAPKDFRQRRPDGQGGWVWNLDGTRRVLYRLPKVIAAVEAGETVYIVEGEKDVHALEAAGVVATCNPMGAGKWREDYNEALRGAQVVIVADRDTAGRRHAQAVATSVQAVAASVRIVEPAEGKDAADHLKSGHKIGDFVAPAADEREPPPESWPDPVPLAGGRRPSFPVATLPTVLRAQVEAVAESVQVPLDIAAGIALGVLSAAAGGLRVQVKADWVEPVAIYVCVVAESGEGKGPVVSAMSAPLERLEREMIERSSEQVAIGQARFDTIEQRLRQAKSAAAKPGAGQVEDSLVADVAAEFAKARRPETPRLLADDVTPEALVSLLARHGQIAVISDEGGVIDTFAGRYSGGVENYDAILKSWSRLPIRVDRKGRAAERVESPVLTMCLAVQPIVIQRIASDPILRGRGVLARFLPFWPHTRLGTRRDDAPPVPAEVSNAWDDLVRELATTTTELTEPTKPGYGDGSVSSVGSVNTSQFLTIDADASAVLRAFRRSVEERLHPDNGDLYAANGWAGKLPGQVVRISGLLHLAEHRTAGVTRPIDEHTMRAAVAIGLYLIDHALAVFGLDGPGGANAPDARRALTWITTSRHATFTHRDIHRALGSKARPTSEEWRPVLDLLDRLGYLRRLPTEQTTERGGRPPSPAYEAHPSLLEAAAV